MTTPIRTSTSHSSRHPPTPSVQPHSEHSSRDTTAGRVGRKCGIETRNALRIGSWKTVDQMCRFRPGRFNQRIRGGHGRASFEEGPLIASMSKRVPRRGVCNPEPPPGQHLSNPTDNRRQSSVLCREIPRTAWRAVPGPYSPEHSRRLRQSFADADQRVNR